MVTLTERQLRSLGDLDRERGARIEELKAALKPFAAMADEMEQVAKECSTDPDGVAVHVPYGVAVVARSVLTKSD